MPVLYLSNSDGSNVQKIDLPDMGYVIDPAWSPNGQLVAFSWRRPSGNYDIYAMDIVSHQTGRTHARRRPQRTAQLGAGRAAPRFRIDAHGHAADLVDAGRRQPAAAADLSRRERIAQLVAQVSG